MLIFCADFINHLYRADLKNLSCFNKLKYAEKQSWYAETNTFTKPATRSADIYVFCVLSEKDKNKVDPLDLGQWFFMVMTTPDLNARLGKQKSVSLSTLEKIGVIRVKFSDLANQIEEIKK